jgi:hypothetical protein
VKLFLSIAFILFQHIVFGYQQSLDFQGNSLDGMMLQIIPQAVCSQHGLAIGAAMAPAVRVLVIAFLPVTYPISKA